MSLCCMSKNIVSLDHTMEEVVAAFRDADKELPMVKMDHSVWLYLVEVVDLHWTVRTFLLLGTAWKDAGKGYDAAGPDSLLWSITEMLQEFGQITSRFLASVSLPIKQEWCHQLPLQSAPRWLESTNEELAAIASKFSRKMGSCSLGPNVINK